MTQLPAPIHVEAGEILLRASETSFLIGRQLLDAYIVHRDFGVVAAEHVVAELQGILVIEAEVDLLFGVIPIDCAVLNVKAHLIDFFVWLKVETVRVVSLLVLGQFTTRLVIHANEIASEEIRVLQGACAGV